MEEAHVNDTTVFSALDRERVSQKIQTEKVSTRILRGHLLARNVIAGASPVGEGLVQHGSLVGPSEKITVGPASTMRISVCSCMLLGVSVSKTVSLLGGGREWWV